MCKRLPPTLAAVASDSSLCDLPDRPVFQWKTGRFSNVSTKTGRFSMKNRLVFQFSDPPDPLRFKGILYLGGAVGACSPLKS
jgi:hypothetical protein